MNPILEKVQNCVASIREKTDFVPEVAIVLGSGLGDYANPSSILRAVVMLLRHIGKSSRVPSKAYIKRDNE